MSLHVEIRKRLPGFELAASFTVEKGPLGLLGPSGAGKSLLLKCIAGLARPDEGRITLDGRALFDSAAKLDLPPQLRRVGLVFQHYALFPHLSAADNIAFGLHELPPGERAGRVGDWLRHFQLEAQRGRRPEKLSGGEQQRVALARALAPRPGALLLDEPLSALDTPLKAQVEKVLDAELREFQGPALFVTHNLEEAYRLCPDLLVLDRGTVISQGSRDEVFRHPPTLAAARITGCKNFSPALLQTDGRIEAPAWGCSLAVAQPRPPGFTHVAIRAHHLRLGVDGTRPNAFPVHIAATRESPFRVTIFLKLHAAAETPDDYDLQLELFRDAWEQFRARPEPWFVELDPERLFLVCDGA